MSSTRPYRKIDLGLWGDERVRALSQIPPCGAGLWIHLLTGPFTNSLPGLFSAGRAAMAESLEWPLELFDSAFREIEEQGMVRADFAARVVWLPNSLKYNLPQSPNVVRSWAATIRRLPECDLKVEALAFMRQTLQNEFNDSGAYIKAWDEACGKALGKPFDMPSVKPMGNQEQEQKQKQDNTPSAAPASRAASEDFSKDFLEAFDLYPKREGGSSKRKAWKAWRARIRVGVSPHDLTAGVQRYAAFCAQTGKTGTQYVKAAETFLGPDEHYLASWEASPAADPPGQTGREVSQKRVDATQDVIAILKAAESTKAPPPPDLIAKYAKRLAS